MLRWRVAEEGTVADLTLPLEVAVERIASESISGLSVLTRKRRRRGAVPGQPV